MNEEKKHTRSVESGGSLIKLSFYTLLALLFSTILGFGLAQAAASSNEQVPGEFIIKMKESRFARGQQKLAGLEKMNAKLLGKAQLKKSISESLHHFHALKYSDTQKIMNELKADPDIEYVEPNYFIHQEQAEPAADQHIYSYDDVQAMNSTGSYIQSLASFGVSEAWSVLSSVDTRPIVAVIDTGADTNHALFLASSSMWINPGEIPGNGIDDDGNGFIDDVYGWNFNAHTANIFDDQGHGTHIAGIVQGVGQDLFASMLTPSKIRIMPLKFMDSTGTGTTAAAVAAIYYAANKGAKVINNSWGGGNYSQALHDALTYAYNQGMVIVSAAGNYSRNNDVIPMYPANLPIPSALSVAATTDYDMLASFSDYGPNTVDVAAPGVGIFSTYPNNSFRYLSGTSMAAPMVAGLAALIAREAPNLTGYQIKEKIMSSTDYIVNLRDKTKAQGRMDSYTSVVNAKTSVSVQAFQPSYTATPPAGAVDPSTGHSSGGCGSIAVVGAKTAKTLQKMNLSEQEIFVYIFLLGLPLCLWFVSRMQWISRPRRAHDRFILQSEVKIKVGDRELVGNLHTIGVGGASFDADAMLARGGQVNLIITGPDGQEQIQVLGQVVWSEQSKSYGVQFAPIRETLLDRIRIWSLGLAKAA